MATPTATVEEAFTVKVMWVYADGELTVFCLIKAKIM